MPKISVNVKKYFKEGFVSGVGWSLGVTLGFTVVSSLIILLLSFVGGLPVIGEMVADIVEATQESLARRNVFIER